MPTAVQIAAVTPAAVAGPVGIVGPAVVAASTAAANAFSVSWAYTPARSLMIRSITDGCDQSMFWRDTLT